MESTILSYHDSLLTKGDLLLLEPSKWLNDKLIGFCFEYFERETFKSEAEDFCFINPDVTQFVKLAADEDIGVFLEPLDLPKKQLICLAVNDSVVTDEVSGSHWSLLVYRRDLEELHHYDSCNQANSEIARTLAKRITKYLGAGKDVAFKEIKSPTQQNSCDCGVYVVCDTEHLCKLYLKQTDQSLLETVTPQYVTQYRSQIKELIHTLSGTS